MSKNTLRIAIVGGRHFNDLNYLFDKTDSYINLVGKAKDITIISGGARGADYLAYRYAVSRGYVFICFPPDPKKKSPERYHERNNKIATFSDICIAFPLGNSRGTWYTVNLFKKANKSVYVFESLEKEGIS